MEYTSGQMLRDIWFFIRPYSKRFWIGTFLRMSQDALYLVVPLIFSKIITFATTYRAGDSLQYLWQLMGIAAVIGIYHHAARDIAKYFIYPIAEKTSIDARLRALQHMMELDSAWHEGKNSGNKLKRIERGGESLNKIIRIYVDLLIESSINVIFISVVFLTLNIKLNAIFVVFFVSYYLLSLSLTRRAVEQSRIVNRLEEDFHGFSFEMLNNIASIKSLGIVKNLLPMLHTVSRKLFDAIRIRVKFFRTREGTLSVYQEIFRLGMIFFTVWEVIHGRFEIGTIALVALYFEKIESSARELSEVYHEFIMSKIGLERMKKILNEEPYVESSGIAPFSSRWKTLRLKNVSFAYHGKNVLQRLSFEIQRGEKIGIVGMSGTGKSTLFKLLLKLYHPTKGEIFFDGMSLRKIQRSSYIRHVAVVPQETELFNLTLKENIEITKGGKFGKKENARLLKRAIESAHVKDFLEKLPDGVNSLIGEKGIKLSGGERQRVGIARAIFKQPDILLLDEATSHLDSESEGKIQKALKIFLKNITAIVIAHRLSTIQSMDRILVIHKGKIAESGTYGGLLKRKGAFWKLWKRQKF